MSGAVAKPRRSAPPANLDLRAAAKCIRMRMRRAAVYIVEIGVT